MLKPALIIPVLDQNNSVLGILNKIDPDNFSKVICLFDSSGWDYVKVIQEAFVWVGGIHNTGKPVGFTKMVNMGLRIAVEEFKTNAIILSQYLDSIDQRLLDVPYVVTGSEPFYQTFIPLSTLNMLGYLDEVFVNSGSCEDYLMRAALRGIPTDVKEMEVEHKHLEMTDFALLQLNYKWGYKSLKLHELKAAVAKDRKWDDSMRCS